MRRIRRWWRRVAGYKFHVAHLLYLAPALFIYYVITGLIEGFIEALHKT